MKAPTLKKKLTLNKTTVVNIDKQSMNAVNGGRPTFGAIGNYCMTDFVPSVCMLCEYTEGWEQTCIPCI